MARLENVRQEKFCRNFCKSGNQTEAYKAAGYKVKSDAAASSAASRLLSNVKVQQRIAELNVEIVKLSEQKEHDAIAQAEEQQRFFTTILRGEISECNGKPIPINVRLKATELLGKMQGLYVNHVETNLNVQPVVIHDDIGVDSAC